MDERNHIEVKNITADGINHFGGNYLPPEINPQVTVTPHKGRNQVELPQSSKKRKKQQTMPAKVLSFAVAVVGATIVGVAVVPDLVTVLEPSPFVFDENSADVSVEPSQEELSYHIEINNYLPVTGITVALDEVSESAQPAETEGDYTLAAGIFSSLAPSTTYTMVVADGDRILFTRQITTLAPPATEFVVELHPMIDGVEFSLTIRHFDWDGLPLSVCLLDQDQEIVSSTECELDLDGEEYAGGGVIVDVQSNTDYVFAIMSGDTVLYTRPVTTALEVYVELTPTGDGAEYGLSIFNYVVADTLAVRVSHGGEDLVFPVSYTNEDGFLTAIGTLTGLLGETEYQFMLMDGQETLYSANFTTLNALGVVLTFDPQEIETIYNLRMNLYEVQDTLYLYVYLNDGSYDNMMPIEYIANELLESEGSVSGLEPNTTYSVQLLDGSTRLYSTTFTTRRHIETGFDLIASATGFDYEFSVLDYEVVSELVLQVYSLDDEYWLYPANITSVEDGNIYGKGSIDGLTPHQYYYVDLLDGEEVIWSDSFTTPAVTSLELSTYPDAIYYTFKLSHFTVTGELRVRADTTESIGEYVVVVEVLNDGQDYLCSGYISDLIPHTTYTFVILEGNDPLYSEEVSTPFNVSWEAQTTTSTMQYWMSILDYEIQDALRLVLTDPDENIQEFFPEASVTADGIFVEDEIGLEYGTTYGIQVMDGDVVLYETNVTTQVIAEITFHDHVTSVLFDLVIRDYHPVDGIRAQVIGAESYQIIDIEVVASSDDQVASEQLIDDLQPNSSYTFVLMDGEHTIYETAFETRDYLQVSLTSYSASVYVNIAVNESYTPTGSSFRLLVLDQDGETVLDQDGELVGDMGTLFCNVELGPLSPATVYTLVVLDGETELFRDTFSTTEA